MVLYKEVYGKKEFGDDLPIRGKFCITPKDCITTEVFCKFLQHFHQYCSPECFLLLGLLDDHRSRVDVSVLDLSKELGINLLCLPAHCSHELQPLDKSFFKSLKFYWNEVVDAFHKDIQANLLGSFNFQNSSQKLDNDLQRLLMLLLSSKQLGFVL